MSAQTPTSGYMPGQIFAMTAIEYASTLPALADPAWPGMFAPVPLLDAKRARCSAWSSA